METQEIFDSCESLPPPNSELLELLNKMMAIRSPVEFDDDFASDQQLEMLVEELDRHNVVSNQASTLLSIVILLPPKKSSEQVFI